MKGGPTCFANFGGGGYEVYGCLFRFVVCCARHSVFLLSAGRGVLQFLQKQKPAITNFHHLVAVKIHPLLWRLDFIMGETLLMQF